MLCIRLAKRAWSASQAIWYILLFQVIKSYAKFSATPKYMTYNWVSSLLKDLQAQPLKYVEVLF